MTNKIVSKKVSAGEYEYTLGDLTVEVSRVELWDGKSWIASAKWNSRLYTDPMNTKRDAVASAKAMIAEEANK